MKHTSSFLDFIDIQNSKRKAIDRERKFGKKGLEIQTYRSNRIGTLKNSLSPMAMIQTEK